MKPVLALSTCWCSQRHQDGYAMLQEMAGLGFEHVELSHGIRITLVPGILRAVEEGVVKISSTHNFCPLPTGVMHAAPNLYEPSSPQRAEYEQWVRHTKRSIDFAAQVGATAVVCHLGSVRFFWLDPLRALRRYLREHPTTERRADDDAFRLLLEKGMTKLRKRMRPFWARLNAGLDEMVDYAARKSVRLGCENREKIEELPLDADFAELLARFPADAPIGYWHDTGHAALKEDVGLVEHRAHLAALASRTIGFHLHDVNAAGHDHHAIGSGRIDFTMVSEFWRPHHLLTLELSPRATAEDVRRSKERIAGLCDM